MYRDCYVCPICRKNMSLLEGGWACPEHGMQRRIISTSEVEAANKAYKELKKKPVPVPGGKDVKDEQ